MRQVREAKPDFLETEELAEDEILELSPEDALILKERLHRRKEQEQKSLLHVETKLFRSIPFLLTFSFAIMNAFLYVYLAMNDFPAVDQQHADNIIHEVFGKDYTYFSPIYEFLIETKDPANLSFPEFKKSLMKLNDSISRFGIHTRSIFTQQSFHFRGNGIYWAPQIFEGQTAYKPSFERAYSESEEE